MSNPNITKEKRKQIKKEKKSTQTTCSQCPADLTSLLKSKTFCSFCLNFVCKSHIIKKRQDPIIEDKLAKICQECEDNILYSQIISKHQQKEQLLQEETQELQSQLDELNNNIQGILTKQSTLQFQMSKEHEEFEKKEQRYQQLLKEADSRYETLNEESRLLNEQHRNLMEVKKTVELKKQFQQEEFIKAKQEEKLIKEQMSNLDQQIEIVSAEISQLNEQLIKMQQTQPLKEPEVKASQNNIYSLDILDSVRQSKLPKQKSEIPKDRPTHQNQFYCFLDKKKK